MRRGKHTTDERIKFVDWHELRDGELANRNDELRRKDFQFAAQPPGAIGDFSWRRHAVAAGGILSGEAATDGSHVNRSAEFSFTQACGFFKPPKQSLPSGPSEGSAEDRFLCARRLADEHHLADDRAAAHYWWLHLGTKPAGEQASNMGGEKSGGGGHCASYKVTSLRR